VKCNFKNTEISFMPNDMFPRLATLDTITAFIAGYNKVKGLPPMSNNSLVDDIFKNGQKIFAITIKAGLDVPFLRDLMTHSKRSYKIADADLPLLLRTDTQDANIPVLKFPPFDGAYNQEFTFKFQPAQRKLWAVTFVDNPELLQPVPDLSYLPLLGDPTPTLNTSVEEYQVRFHPAHVWVDRPGGSWVMRVFSNEVLAREGMGTQAHVFKFRCEGKLYYVF